MGKQTFRKEQELLRAFAVDTGKYNRRKMGYIRSKMANELGLSFPDVDKTKSSVSETLHELQYDLEQQLDGFGLSQLYRMQSLTDAQAIRYYSIIKVLEKNAPKALDLEKIYQNIYELTATEDKDSPFIATLDQFAFRTHGKRFYADKSKSGEKRMDADRKNQSENQREHRYDKKTIAKDINRLCGLGYVSAVKDKENYGKKYYLLQKSPFEYFKQGELEELHDFIRFCIAESAPAAFGYLLLQMVEDHLVLCQKADSSRLNIQRTLYDSYWKILDEQTAYSLLEAIRKRMSILIHYFYVNTSKKYNKRGEDDPDLKVIRLIPLRVVLDDRYARWYLLAWNDEEKRMEKFRLDYIFKMEALQSVPPEEWDRLQISCQRTLATAWMVDTSPAVTVKARFYHPLDVGGNQYVLRRVLEEAPAADIVHDKDSSFMFQIEVNGISEIKPWLMSFGSHVEVLEPLQLREFIIQDLEAVVSHYEPLS